MAEEAEDPLGFKRLTMENWLLPDDIHRLFLVPRAGNTLSATTPSDIAGPILAPSLGPTVPINVTRLFEAARGAMLYGWFFYPLYALALEQLYRVTDAGLVSRCKQLGAPENVKSFHDRIEWLTQRGVIRDADKPMWHGFRRLRNIASHAEEQSLYPPGMAMQSLRRVVEALNDLFASEGKSGPV